MSTAPNLRMLRRRCEARLRGLEIPRPFQLEALCRMVEAQRGRPLVLQPLRGLGGSTMGVWIAISKPPMDVVIHEQATTRLHQEHIVLHELSHILCDHTPRATDADLAGTLFPDLRPELVRGILQRESYSSDQEVEAELMASLIREQAAGTRSYESNSPQVDSDLVKRLEAFRQGESPD